MVKAPALAATLTVAILASASAETRSWTCEKQPIFHPAVKEGIASISTDKYMRNIITDYMIRWDVSEMRKQCDAFAAGEPYEISCLNGRRDWKAIRAMIPEDVQDLSPQQKHQHVLDLQAEGISWLNGIDYCDDIGALNYERR